MRPVYFLAAAALIASPALAQDPLAPVSVPLPAPQPVVPEAPAAIAPPAAVVRIPSDWNQAFAAIRAGRWAEAEAGIAALPPHVLTPVAKAELFLAKGSPQVPLNRILALLSEAPDLPQAEQLARLALARGAATLPPYVQKRSTGWLGNSPGRTRARPVSGEAAADALRAQLDPLVKSDSAEQAELLLMQSAPTLSYEARAEAGQRVAWAYYAAGRDSDSRRVADTYRQGATGDWAPHSAWVAGLAAWRMGDCNAASRAFQEVGSTSRERELSAAGYYWAARSEQSCRRPQSVAALLQGAARSSDSFYGLLARETLGLDTRLPGHHATVFNVQGIANVRRAMELAAIGQVHLAEELLRHQARIGNPAEHHGLIDIARQLDLAGVQYWLAHNGQPGAQADPRDRYPLPRWAPVNGWRVDPAIALAHIRQELTFQPAVVSPVGAVGLMQVMPGTASTLAKSNGLPSGRNDLVNPALNMEFGQNFLERMRSSSATQGHLPKVIAAYNAGPLPVGRWAWLDRGDPLLWVESIPYYETRHYVPAVMRNYWIYQGMMGVEQASLRDLAQNRWPYFPTTFTLAMSER